MTDVIAEIETWVVGYTERDLSGKKPEVELDGGRVATHWGYAYYGNFEEAKSALLSIVGSVGLDMMKFNFPQWVVQHMAEAAVELLNVNATDVGNQDKPLFCDVDGQMAFFLGKGELEYEPKPHMSWELIADHRLCTDDHCYSEDSVSGKVVTNERPYEDKLTDEHYE